MHQYLCIHVHPHTWYAYVSTHHIHTPLHLRKKKEGEPCMVVHMLVILALERWRQEDYWDLLASHLSLTNETQDPFKVPILKTKQNKAGSAGQSIDCWPPQTCACTYMHTCICAPVETRTCTHSHNKRGRKYFPFRVAKYSQYLICPTLGRGKTVFVPGYFLVLLPPLYRGIDYRPSCG